MPVANTAKVKPPTADPGPPPTPKPKRAHAVGRKPDALKEYERQEAVKAAQSEREANREIWKSQIGIIRKPLAQIWRGVFGTVAMLAGRGWNLSKKQSTALAESSGMVLAKYVDLDRLDRFKEELILAYTIAGTVEAKRKSAARCRADDARKAKNGPRRPRPPLQRSRGGDGDGKIAASPTADGEQR